MTQMSRKGKREMNILKKINLKKDVQKEERKEEKLHNKTENAPKKIEARKKKNKMIVLKKKQLVAFSLIGLVAIAGYLNTSFQYDLVDPEVAEVYNEASKKLGEAQMVNATQNESSKDVPKETTVSENGYFSAARIERETRRDESIETLMQLINSDGADKEAKKTAQEQVHELADYTEKEVLMENMIKAKGYTDTVVFMGENLVSVAVCSAGLNEVDAAVITDIATSVTGYGAAKVNIVEVGE